MNTATDVKFRASVDTFKTKLSTLEREKRQIQVIDIKDLPPSKSVLKRSIKTNAKPAVRVKHVCVMIDDEIEVRRTIFIPTRKPSKLAQLIKKAKL